VASLTRGEVDVIVDIDPAVDGQPPIMLEEFIAVDEIVKAAYCHGRWRGCRQCLAQVSPRTLAGHYWQHRGDDHGFGAFAGYGQRWRAGIPGHGCE
jgi:hypothetical protein